LTACGVAPTVVRQATDCYAGLSERSQRLISFLHKGKSLMNDDQVELISIPIPEDGDPVLDLAATLKLEVEDVSQGEGYFAVDYRRC
jgi:hypothetical protein